MRLESSVQTALGSLHAQPSRPQAWRPGPAVVLHRCYTGTVKLISQRELRNDNAKVVRRVLAGESFIVTRNGVPVADLVPHSRRPAAVAIPVEELRALLDVPVDAEAWSADVRAAHDWLDDDDRDPWAARE